jgi:hypothetical protein
MKRLLLGVALSSLLFACPSPPVVPPPVVVDEEQSGGLLGSLSGYSGGAGTVRVFALAGGIPQTATALATGTIGADGVFSVFFPNSTVMTPLASEVTCASIGSGTATDDGCLVEGAGKVAGVAVGVYNSGNTLLGYLQLKTPAFVGNASRTVVHYFASAALKVQVKKTSSGAFPIIDNYYQSFRKGWNLGLITATTTASSSNFDHVIAGTYPRDVRWALVASATAVNAPLAQK